MQPTLKRLAKQRDKVIGLFLLLPRCDFLAGAAENEISKKSNLQE